MGKIVVEYKSKYDRGDVVVFQKHDTLAVGVIEGYNIYDRVFWYNIRLNPKTVCTYTNGGDVYEEDILFRLDPEQVKMVRKHIAGDSNGQQLH